MATRLDGKLISAEIRFDYTLELFNLISNIELN